MNLLSQGKIHAIFQSPFNGKDLRLEPWVFVTQRVGHSPNFAHARVRFAQCLVFGKLYGKGVW